MAGPVNNFNSFRSEFITDTGLDFQTNADTYIQYVQARLLDLWIQQQNSKMDKLIDEVKKLGT